MALCRTPRSIPSPAIGAAGSGTLRKLLRALGTPTLLDSLEARVGAPYADGIDESIPADELRARFVARLIEWKRPALMLGYLTAFDHEQHEAGPWMPRAFAVLERVDAALDTIVQAARRTYGNEVTIAVVSDHGFAATHTEVHLGVALARAGLITVPASGEERPSDWRAMIWPSGELCGPVPGGTHGYPPQNAFMRASFFMVGPGIAPGISLVVIDMRDVAPTLAARLGIVLPRAEGGDVLRR